MRRIFWPTVLAGNALLLGAAAYLLRPAFDFRIGILNGWTVPIPKAVAVLLAWAIVAGPITAAAVAAKRGLRKGGAASPHQF